MNWSRNERKQLGLTILYINIAQDKILQFEREKRITQ